MKKKTIAIIATVFVLAGVGTIANQISNTSKTPAKTDKTHYEETIKDTKRNTKIETEKETVTSAPETELQIDVTTKPSEEAQTDPPVETTAKPQTELVTEPPIEVQTDPLIIIVTEPPMETTPIERGEMSKDYVLNTSTMKFHYPSCSSVSQIKAENREDVYATRSEVIARGFEPCKRCDP